MNNIFYIVLHIKYSLKLKMLFILLIIIWLLYYYNTSYGIIVHTFYNVLLYVYVCMLLIWPLVKLFIIINTLILYYLQVCYIYIYTVYVCVCMLLSFGTHYKCTFSAIKCTSFSQMMGHSLSIMPFFFHISFFPTFFFYLGAVVSSRCFCALTFPFIFSRNLNIFVAWGRWEWWTNT